MVSFGGVETGTPAHVWHAALSARPVPAATWPPRCRRLVVVAAHPDDETLGAAGLMQAAAEAGLAVDVVVATRGEASHPDSPTYDRRQMASLREAEAAAALDTIVPGLVPELLGFPDGGLAEHEESLLGYLVGRLGDGRDALIVAPWRADGHPDHESAGHAAAAAAVRTGAELLEYPIWFRHWGTPAQAPWEAARVHLLPPDQRDRKRAAIACHRTQVGPLSNHPGDETLLEPEFLAHFEGSEELFWALAPTDPALDTLHARSPDPWGTEHRWYERRKRSLLLATLPRERFRLGLEVGCSTGTLAADLATRCGSLVAVDTSANAVQAAATRLGDLPHVRVEHLAASDDWPSPAALGGRPDLVVVSEVGYFLSPRAVDALAAHLREALAEDGVLVLCHWRHGIEGWPLNGPEVHARLLDAGLPPVAATYQDRDVEILVLTDPEQLPVADE